MFEIFYNFNVCSIIFLLFYVSKGEYRIKEGHVPVYLNYTFVNLAEDVFPRDINIFLSLSKMAGTLLYSVDNKNNQIIMSLNDADSPTLDVEINTNHIYISLIKICGCIRCRFEKISLRIQMKDVMYLSCNNEKIESYQFVRSNKMNKDYPIPKFQKSDKLEAYLWLVNTPEMDGIYPNSAQLSGCIFEVTYNKQPLKMGQYGALDKCPITCTINICNGGQCLETYNNYPVCNCTDSFMNGQYCNATLQPQFCNATQMFQFKVMKITFENVSGNMFSLFNTEFNLKLVAEEGRLVFLIEFDSFMHLIKYTLTKPYNMKETHIVIIQFNTASIHIKYRSQNTSWKDFTILFPYDLSGSIFERLIMDNNGGLIEFRYKNVVNDITWYPQFYLNDSACHLYNTLKKVEANTLDENQRTIPIKAEDIQIILEKLKNLEHYDIAIITISVIAPAIVLIILSILYNSKCTTWNVLPVENIFPINKVTKSFIENDQNLVDTNEETLIMMENNEGTVLNMESDQTMIDSNDVLMTNRCDQDENEVIFLAQGAIT